MIVTRLKLTNLRAIEAMEFKFQSGCNLIVGVNGAGKTSLLDALAVCLSALVKDVNRLRTPVESFSIDDIRIGAQAVTIECEFNIGDRSHGYLIHKPRATSVPQERGSGLPREQIHSTPERAEYIGAKPKVATGSEPEGRPLAVLFSTRRAMPSERARATSAAAGGIRGAYSEAFANRELRLKEFADWMHARDVLGKEDSETSRVLDTFEDAVRRFLPGYKNLRVDEESSRLMIDHGDTALEVKQLSDGERGTLAMVLDLTRRLSEANPEIPDPAAHVEAVVLIDEIDLHLHPQWQRQILRNLSSAFPKCQFIATTHSPQVIGEIEHGRIQIISDGQVYSPTHSFGVDSSRILEEIMESRQRAESVQTLLYEISRAIDSKNLGHAKEVLTKLVEQVGENDPEVTRTRTLLEFMGAER